VADPLTPAERALLTHVTMFGSDGYPVQRVGSSWQWVDAFGVGGAPTVYRTKRAAVAAFELWLEAMRRKLGEAAQERARDKLLAPRCDVECCGVAASWRARKLYGDGGTLLLCDQHRPQRQPGLPFAYEVVPHGG
jgi:hypothetical protein